MFGPLEELGDHHFDDDDGVETFVAIAYGRDQIRNMMTELKTSNSVGKMCG